MGNHDDPLAAPHSPQFLSVCLHIWQNRSNRGKIRTRASSSNLLCGGEFRPQSERREGEECEQRRKKESTDQGGSLVSCANQLPVNIRGALKPKTCHKSENGQWLAAKEVGQQIRTSFCSTIFPWSQDHVSQPLHQKYPATSSWQQSRTIFPSSSLPQPGYHLRRPLYQGQTLEGTILYLEIPPGPIFWEQGRETLFAEVFPLLINLLCNS